MEDGNAPWGCGERFETGLGHSEESGQGIYAKAASAQFCIGAKCNMIERHWQGIAAYSRVDNKVLLGFVEGLNNKIRVIQRRAYGRSICVLKYSHAYCRRYKNA